MRRLLLTVAIATMTVLSSPMLAKADDNAIAQFIMQKLKVEQQRGNLKGFHVDMRVDKGTVWFEGYVANSGQEKLILQTAQKAGHLGVIQVVDDIDVRAANAITQNRGTAPRPMQTARAVSYTQDSPMGSGTVNPPSPVRMQQPPMGGSIGAPVQGRPMGGQMGGPMPIGYQGQGAAMATDHPQLPGYAWPGYASHPNYAAVTYPKMYSPSAWPYIGPFYPYPQVPLGWRKVTLEWDDGWWFLDFNDR